MAFISLNDVVNNHHYCRPSRPHPAPDHLSPQVSEKIVSKKVSEVSSLPNCAGNVGFGKAVEVLDSLGISMSNFNLSNEFVRGMSIKDNKISILAFEVANTVVKGSNIMKCLWEENVKHLKESVLPSEGVQCLVSKDMNELLKIACYDIREDLKIFTLEVVRFGNRCVNPQWHNLDRYFQKLASELIISHRQPKKEAQAVLKQLMTLVQYTAELYHELHELDMLEQDYWRKLQAEENSTTAQSVRGSLSILRRQIKSQRKLVKNLKKKSLWSKILEEVVEKLVDIVHLLYLEIHLEFGTADSGGRHAQSFRRLGPAGLALHYANIISQIDTLVSCSSAIPPSARDTLYQGLPRSIKSALRSKLQSFQVKEELTIPQIKTEMEKTLQWLVPIATNTTKAHHGFGWVSEWANTGSEVNRKSGRQNEIIKLETLHHADKEKTEAYILELVIGLHHLVRQSISDVHIKFLIKSPTPQDKVNIVSSTSGIKQKGVQYKKTINMGDRFDIDKVRVFDAIDGVDTLRSL